MPSTTNIWTVSAVSLIVLLAGLALVPGQAAADPNTCVDHQEIVCSHTCINGGCGPTADCYAAVGVYIVGIGHEQGLSCDADDDGKIRTVEIGFGP